MLNAGACAYRDPIGLLVHVWSATRTRPRSSVTAGTTRVAVTNSTVTDANVSAPGGANLALTCPA